MLKVEPLAWDSNFLGFPVAKIVLESDICLQELYEFVQQNPFKLTYIFDKCNYLHQKVCEDNNFYLVDTKVTFKKNLSKSLLLPSDNITIEEYNNSLIASELYDLAILAGKYSRFAQDPLLPKDIQPKLYCRWLENSLNGSFAQKVWVAKQQERIIGFITLALQDSQASIGLIAVHDTFQRQGIGKKLLQTVENWCITQSSVQTLKVITQQTNQNACCLYQRYGFEVESIIPIFHAWKL